MGILDAVLGRNFPTKKFEDLLHEALAELKYSKPRFEKEISRATSSVTKLLKEEKPNKAYRKVNIVIEKQNHLDACNIIIGYLRLLIANVDRFKTKIDIPEEHLEAVSSVIFAAPRIKVSSCFTAIQDVRKILLSHFGRNLAAQYLEIRNNCGINPRIIEKLSEEPSPREVRMEFLKEIAAKAEIVLELEEASTSTEGTSDTANKLASEEILEDETRKDCELSDPSGKKKKNDVADADKEVGNSSKSPKNKQIGQEKKGNDDGSTKRGDLKQKGKEKKVDVADAEKAVGNSSKGPGNKQPEQEKEGNDDGSAERGNMKHKGKEKKIDVDDADKEVNSSKSPKNKQIGQEKKGNDGSAKRGDMKQKGKEKKLGVADAEKAVGNSSKEPVNKQPEQEKKGNDGGSAEIENMKRKGKEKKVDVADADKVVENSSKGPVNKQPGQEKKNNDDGSAERGNMKQKEKKKKVDVADADKEVGNSSKGPKNKQPGQEKKGNDDGSAKRGDMKQKGKEKKVDVTENGLGNSSNGPEKEKSEQEQEGSDVRSESERRVASDSEEISKLPGYIEEWLETGIEIDWSVANSEDVDHMVNLVEETAELKRPLSIRTRRIPEQ